jgi:hypothetical protein
LRRREESYFQERDLQVVAETLKQGVELGVRLGEAEISYAVVASKLPIGHVQQREGFAGGHERDRTNLALL